MAALSEVGDDDVVILEQRLPSSTSPTRPPSSRRREKRVDPPRITRLNSNMDVDPTEKISQNVLHSSTTSPVRPRSDAATLGTNGESSNGANTPPALSCNDSSKSPQYLTQRESSGLIRDPVPAVVKNHTPRNGTDVDLIAGAGAGESTLGLSPPSSEPLSLSSLLAPSPAPSKNEEHATATDNANESGDNRANGVDAASPAPNSTVPGPSQKPKPKPARRSPSPSPLLPPLPRLTTIRLEIRLGGPEDYSIDISQLAKETGQRSPTPPPQKRDFSDTEGDEDVNVLVKGKGKGKGKGKTGKRKSLVAEEYDTSDPFIDDSELAVDERTYFAQTKQQGFYVSSGEVALLKDRARDHDREDKSTTPKKPKSKRSFVPTIIPLAGSQAVSAAAAASTSATVIPLSKLDSISAPPLSSQPSAGTHDAPMIVSDTEDFKGTDGNANVLKRKASIDFGNSAANQNNGKKKRKTVEIEIFHPELQVALHELKAAIAQQSFEQKGKFPPALKPILARVALKAIVCGEYNDNFFCLMPKLFIYNKFTMSKLIKRTVYADHQKLLAARQDELLVELKQLADEGFEKAQEEYEKNVQAWERRMEKQKAEAVGTQGQGSAEGTPAPGSTTPSVSETQLPSSTALDEAIDDVEGGQSSISTAGGDKTHSSQHMPQKRYRLTDRMRNIIWELVVLSNESVRIENEKNTLENSTVQVSEQGNRKVLYQKIVASFPEGWMSSGQISREVSVMKKRYEAQQAEEAQAALT